jgi:hypothetical protein
MGREDDRRRAAVRRVLPLALAAVLTGCSDPVTPPAAVQTPEPTAAPSATAPSPPAPTTSAPTPSPTAVWLVGASPLPIGPDGFGVVAPTPRVLRDRRLPTYDALPPPRDGAFHSTVAPISDGVRRRMGDTLRPGCPVQRVDLRYVTVTFRGFDGAAHTGELVVATSAAPKVVRAFRRLFALGFPIEQMVLPTTDDLDAPPTGDGNDTAGFVCRAARGQTRFSAHAYGLAIDVNPFHNPYVKGDLVLPELASAYTDRSWRRPGMLLAGSAAVRAFTDEGFTWGGDFRSLKDYQHVTLTGD